MDHRRNLKRIEKCFKVNENENTPCQNLWVATVTVARGKFIALNVYFREEERSKTNNLYFRKVENEQIETNVSRRKEIRIKAKINEIENRKSIEKISETKSWF